jgi:hypothetical protein
MAAIESVWSLQAAGFRVAAFARRGARPVLRRMPGVTVHEIPPPEEGVRSSLRALQTLIRRMEPSVVLPLDDHALWLCSRLEDAGAPIAGATGRAAECALDKLLQLELAGQAGLDVPSTAAVNEPERARPAAWPVVVKPSQPIRELEGRLVRPTGVVCENAEQLRQARDASRGPVLVQPLIRGTGEGLFGHAGPGGVRAWSAHRRVRMVNPHGSASSACRSVPIDADLVAASERFIEGLGWRGMFMLEFLRDLDGRPWFMELNGRAWGSMALARRRGFEYPAWTVRATLDPGWEPVGPADPPHLVARNLGLELVHLMFIARGPRSRGGEWPSLYRSVRDVCARTPDSRLYNWNRRQPRVLWSDTVGTLGVYARRAFGGRA